MGEQLLGSTESQQKSNMRAVFAVSLLLLALSSCSSRKQEVFTYPTRKLPPEERYSDRAWVHPATVVSDSVASTSFEQSDAPLLKPADPPPAAAVMPKLPKARKDKY